MLESVQFILLLFTVFYLLILFYDFVSLISRKQDELTEKKYKEKLLNEISTKNITKLKKLLSKLNVLSILNTMLEENEKITNHKIVTILNQKEYKQLFIDLTKIYSKKDELSKSCYCYTLSYIKITDEEVTEFILNNVVSNSIYNVENALKCLYKNKNIEAISRALELISENEIIYSAKLITDGMQEYAGDIKELCDNLYSNYDIYNDEIKIGIINFFKNNSYDISESLFEKLQKKNSKELEIALIRYFTKVNYKEAYKLFIDRLANDYYNDFEYNVVMVQTLENYDTKETIKILKEMLSNSNYYVRYNSAKVLKKLGAIDKLGKIEDKYSKEMIEYINSQEV